MGQYGWRESERIVQERLGYTFSQGELLVRALTHSSWANEQNCPGEHNERLEFLGDAVLELCISTLLFKQYPGEREGRLTKLRASLVAEPYLAELAIKVGIPQALLLGRGEEQQAGRTRASLLADALEAVLAAVYLDGGFVSAFQVVKRIFPVSLQAEIKATGKNPKCELQELCQKLFRNTPSYTLIEASGPDHARSFRIKLALPDGREFWGDDTSRKKAEQSAAVQALAEYKKGE